MNAKKSSRKKKTRGGPRVQQEPNVEGVTSFSDAETSAGSNWDGSNSRASSGHPFPAAQFARNYCASVLLHAYMAFLPALQHRLLSSSPFFRNWHSDTVTLLAVFLASVSWMELFDIGCIADAGSAFISLMQEKQFRELCGSYVTAETKRRWIVGGISGLLGALTVGLLTAVLSPFHPFGAVLPLPQQLFHDVPREDGVSPSLVTDILRLVISDDQTAGIATSLKAAAHAAVARCPTPLVPLLYGLQGTLKSVSSAEVLRVCSLCFDIFVAEFLCCFTVYLVTAVVSSAAFYFELRHAGRINLAVLLLAIAVGLPYCRAVGGPMLGMSFSALVAGSRLDPWCFLLTASADFLAAVCATRIVQPVPVALSSMPKRDAFKKTV